MKKYDPYKRLILFIASFINILLLCLLFAAGWYRYYAGTMYVITFYRRGHYVVIALYGMMLLFFSNMYGSLKIGQYRRIEVLLSQFLSLLLTNILFYFIISLLAFGFVNPFVLCLIMAAEMVVTTIWNSLVIYFYNSIFQPWKLLLIYGERSAKDLIYKVETRRDKYAIYDSINIAEGMEAIKQKMQDFHAVIIGDITAECRNDLLKYCYMCEKRAYVVPKLSDLILMGAERIHVFDTPFLLSRGYALSFDERLLKRLLDLVLSFVLLVVTSPILVLVSAAVKLCDGGRSFIDKCVVPKMISCLRSLSFEVWWWMQRAVKDRYLHPGMMTVLRWWVVSYGQADSMNFRSCLIF